MLGDLAPCTGGISVTCRRSIPVSVRAGQRRPPHPAHARRLVPDHHDRDGQSAASSRPAAPSAGPACARVFFRSDFGSGLRQPVRRRRLRGVLRVLLHPRGQVRDLRLQIRYQHLQLADPRIPPGQQFPQPRVRRAQPGNHLIRSGLAGRRGHIGHNRHIATAGLP